MVITRSNLALFVSFRSDHHLSSTLLQGLATLLQSTSFNKFLHRFFLPGHQPYSLLDGTTSPRPLFFTPRRVNANSTLFALYPANLVISSATLASRPHDQLAARHQVRPRPALRSLYKHSLVPAITLGQRPYPRRFYRIGFTT
jgi:hypothetical protein